MLAFFYPWAINSHLIEFAVGLAWGLGLYAQRHLYPPPAPDAYAQPFSYVPGPALPGYTWPPASLQ